MENIFSSRDKYGIEFQPIDMRWGVRDESTDDHMTTNISLEELENCQNVSVGPSFFFLMGQKYGYRPLPTSVPGDQFECLLQAEQCSTLIGRESSRYCALIGWNHKDTAHGTQTLTFYVIRTHRPNRLWVA